MSEFELYVSHLSSFGGRQSPFEKADYVAVGVPFDLTSTYRTGARFAPAAIREASLNIESYSFLSNMDLEELKIHDLGDLHVSSSVEETLKRLAKSVKALLVAKKTTILVGGEHTITLGAMRSVGGADTAVISLDAHLDLRNQHLGLSKSHATFMRRLSEEVKPGRIVEIGTRAVCREELKYAEKAGIVSFTAKQIQREGLEATVAEARKAVEDFKRTYLTIDMDVLDPAFAPAVQNPEPDGLTFNTLLGFIYNLCDSRTVGLDLVEVAPSYDRGITSVQAAKIIFEALCRIESMRRD